MKQLFYLACFIFLGFAATAQNNYDVAQYFKTLQNAKNLYVQKQWKEAAMFICWNSM
jgi:hypothetical protein